MIGMVTWRYWGLAGCLAVATGLALPNLHADLDDQTRLALETLSRLKDADLEANAALKGAVLKVLEKTRGEPEFVEIVRDFRLPGQEAELVRVAGLHPQTPQAVEAVRMVLASSQSAVLTQALEGEQASALIEVLGRSGDARAVPFIQPLLNREAVQKAAALALTQSQDGAVRLLALQKEGALPPSLVAMVGPTLRSARWPDVRSAALTAFPETTAASDKSTGVFPPIADLLQMTGDPQKGLAIFRRPEVACSTCHQVNGEGVDFGPKLSEIGSKLGKDALIAAILEPSAGISFGFEAWRVELKNGDEVFGLIVSDAEDEVEVKQQGGQSQRIKKADIAAREKQSLSIMPAGLHQALTPQEFVDLIAYLSSLKKVER